MSGSVFTGSSTPKSPSPVTETPSVGRVRSQIAEASTPAYSATSKRVRRVPPVRGTVSGHGAKRRVFGRSQ